MRLVAKRSETMTLPTITRDTLESLKHDLQGDSTDLLPSVMLARIHADNPQLALAIDSLAGGSLKTVGAMLYIVELIERQIESDRMDEAYR